MEENTIFQQESSPKKETPQNRAVASEKSSPMQMRQQPLDSNENSGFPSALIIKGILGLFFAAFVFFIVMQFVLPKFKQTTKGTVNILYWGLWEDDNIMKGIIADFEKNNTNIKISYIKQDNKQYKNRVMTRIQNGSGPDIFLFHNTWLPQMYTFLLPLPNDVMSKDEFQNFFYPVVINDLTRRGAIYGIPTNIDVLSLFINTEIFTNAGVIPPTNWQEFANTARLLTVKDETGKIKTSGTAMGTFDNIIHAPDIMSLLFAQNGANFSDLSQNQKSVVDALDFYASFAKDEGKVWDTSLDPSIIAFAKGNVAMYFGYSWDIFAIKQLNPQFSFKVVSVPHLSGRAMTIASYWANGVSAKSKHQKEAMIFIKFLSQKDIMQKLFTEESKTRLFGELYPRKDLADSLKDNQLVYPFISQANDAMSSFFASDTFDDGINSQMNAYLGNAVRSVLNGTSAETAVETLTKGVAQVLGQYGQ
ncbi:MAG: sugar ABC transporter substrate-binding protein [Candidatus Levyibacteriota bacterium]|nr:MAG: sugar ABC transporter substrate-binding protein [Candidatus Levybacteria bacterium]